MATARPLVRTNSCDCHPLEPVPTGDENYLPIKNCRRDSSEPVPTGDENYSPIKNCRSDSLEPVLTADFSQPSPKISPVAIDELI